MQQRKPIIQREFRGVNKLNPLSIQNAFGVEVENYISDVYPALTVRPGYSVLGTYGTKVLGLGVWKDTQIHAVFNDGTWRRLNSDGSWTTLVSGLSTTAEWTFTNYMGDLSGINLFGTNGVNGVRRYDGTTTLTTLAEPPTTSNYITTYQNRLWIFDSASNEVWASSLDVADDWNTFVGDDQDSYRKSIESPTGETINGLFSELAKLTVSFPYSTRKLLGSVPSDFNDQTVSQTIGVMNNKSAVTIDGFMYLYSSKGFYQYAGGVSPDKSFSEVVQYYADNANPTGRTLSAAGTDGKKIYFSVAQAGSTPDTILVYDQTRGIWNVWKGISALHTVRMGDSFYIGDASGRVLKLGGTTDGGTAITSKLVSKPLTAPSMSQKMRWTKFWLTVDLPVGSSISVYLSKSASGDSDWVQIGATVSGTGSIIRRPITFPSGAVPPSEQIRYKIEGTGPYTIYEIAYEPSVMPLV